MDSSANYVGTELGLFAQAKHWKRYVGRQVGGFIRGHVLEVGSGIGGTTPYLFTEQCKHWTCLEPDAELAGEILQVVGGHSNAIAEKVSVVVGTISDLEDRPQYDAILYVDVLEHLEDDKGEVGAAARRLRPGGHLIVVSPAHQCLFTPFDAAIGHFRRYNRGDLRNLTTPGLALTRLRYLDSVGLIASLGNRLLLKSSMPSRGQIAVWDRAMVPLSRLFDPLFGYLLGKSVYAVWKRVGPK